MTEPLVLDAPALCQLLLGGPLGQSVRESVRGHPVHITDQAQLAVGQELSKMWARGELDRAGFEHHLERLVEAPLIQHLARELLPGACRRRGFRLEDALAVELSERLGAHLVTTSSGLAGAWPGSWLVTPRTGQPGQLREV